MNFLSKFLRFFAGAVFSVLFFSCGGTSKIIVWTDRSELVSYLDYYNVTQHKVKAVIVYKEHLANSLPPAKDEKKPDVIIGSFLKNGKTKKYFAQLDGILRPDRVNASLIYESLLQYGRVNESQYLLPVSFNLPVMIFSVENSELVDESGITIGSEKIKTSSASFNEKNSHKIFTKMGFAPSWNPDFLYELAKARNAEFCELSNNVVNNFTNKFANTFDYDENALDTTISYIKSWTTEKNESTAAEQDFAFKYLYMPDYKQVVSDRCLYSYVTSDRYFSLSAEQIKDLDYRWLSEDGKICIEDEIVTAGIYRKSENPSGAKEFLVWLLSEDTQKKLLDRSAKMQLDTTIFGICNGFSSLKTVNERFFPSYYTDLLGNLPSDEALRAPQMLSPRWQSLKERVIIPYLIDAVKTDSKTAPKTIEERLNAWRKQFY